jgi:hypothetical protein
MCAPSRWYFDAIPTSKCTNASLDIVFYDAGPDGFPVDGYSVGPLEVSVSGTFPNSSHFEYYLQTTGGQSVIVEDDKTGMSADWQGSGAAFHGSKGTDSSIEYVITLSNTTYGLTGTVTYQAIVPPRLACGVDVKGQSELAFPTAYWSIPVNDAQVTVDLSIAGTPLKFTGSGYHDHNWGISPFTESATVSYWGRARVGPYSIVWADAQSPTDPSAFAGNTSATKEYTTGYVAENGRIIGLTCGVGNVTARPWSHKGDGGDAYPPIYSTPAPEGFEVKLAVNGGKTLLLNVTNTLIVEDDDGGVYQRFIGDASAHFEGGDEVWTGRALYEQFKLAQ